MARIRSIHPSFFTDEAVVSCGALARLLYIGLWTDADDQGLFEWKPLQIKMRLLPGDNADTSELLSELLEAGLVAEFTLEGKRFGAIRDFRTYQRPKKPNSVHVLPAEWRTFVGLGDASSEPDSPETGPSPEPVPHRFPTEGEKSPQMEDGGEDVGKEEREDRFALVAATAPTETKPAKRSSKFVPENWSPTEAHVTKAADLGVDLAAQVELFRLHEFRDPKSNFDMAFHRWLRNAPSFAGRAANQNAPGPGGKRDWDPMDQAINGIDWDAPTEDAA